MPLVNRDPFARSELHKERVYNPPQDGCSECGVMPLTPKSKRPFLFRFIVESDGGRRSVAKGLFCGTQCYTFYNT